MEASRGHPGGRCRHIWLTVTIPGVSCGPGMCGQATEPWLSESAGRRAGAVVLPRTGCLGQLPGWNRCPSCGEPKGRQGGSHWFGRITSSKRNHSPVTVFHCLTALNASRPGIWGAAQRPKSTAGGALPLPRGGTWGKCLPHPEPLFPCESPVLTSPPAFLGALWSNVGENADEAESVRRLKCVSPHSSESQ